MQADTAEQQGTGWVCRALRCLLQQGALPVGGQGVGSGMEITEVFWRKSDNVIGREWGEGNSRRVNICQGQEV